LVKVITSIYYFYEYLVFLFDTFDSGCSDSLDNSDHNEGVRVPWNRSINNVPIKLLGRAVIFSSQISKSIFVLFVILFWVLFILLIILVDFVLFNFSNISILFLNWTISARGFSYKFLCWLLPDAWLNLIPQNSQSNVLSWSFRSYNSFVNKSLSKSVSINSHGFSVNEILNDLTQIFDYNVYYKFHWLI
jgi:hypothetical protein